MSSRDLGIVALVVVGILVALPVLGSMGIVGGWGIMGPHMMRGPWLEGRWGGGWGMPFMGVLWLVILVGIGLLIGSSLRRGPAALAKGEAPLDILKRRLAAGEITREEYDALKEELS